MIATAPPRILGRLLVGEGLLSERDLERALEAQRGTGKRLGEVLLSMRLVGDEALARALAMQLSLPFQPAPLAAEPEAAGLLRAELAVNMRQAGTASIADIDASYLADSRAG